MTWELKINGNFFIADETTGTGFNYIIKRSEIVMVESGASTYSFFRSVLGNDAVVENMQDLAFADIQPVASEFTTEQEFRDWFFANCGGTLYYNLSNEQILNVLIGVYSLASDFPSASDNVDKAVYLDTLDGTNGIGFYLSDGTDWNLQDLGKVKNTITTSLDRTFSVSDASCFIKLDGTTDRIWTVPPFSSEPFPKGSIILGETINTAELDILAGAGVTINSDSSNLSIDGNYNPFALINTDTDEWTLAGKLKA